MLLTVLLFVLGIVVVVAIFTMISMYALITCRVPFVSLPQKRIDRILAAAPLAQGKMVYELGCGDGRFLITAYRKYGTLGIGWEINLWAYARAVIRTYPYRKYIKIKYSNFLKDEWHDPNYLFTYLLPAVQNKTEEKIKEAIKKPCQLLAFAFPLPNIKPTEVIYTEDSRSKGQLYLYNL